MNYYWGVIYRYIDIILVGVLLTLKISAISLALSIPIGLIAGLMRVSENKLIYFISSVYVEIVRGVPLLVLLLWVYFGLGQVVRLGSYISGIVGLAIFSGAFIAEIVRSGIQSVSKGQVEAARSSGMTYVQSMRLVILPQAIKTVLPAMASQFILLIKDSSLVSTISVVELTLTAKNIVATTVRPMEVWTFVALLYFIMTFSLSRLIRYFENKYKISI